MLWKPYRLRKNWQFQEIIKLGQKFSNHSFIVFSVQNKLDNCQFGISVPQKMVKKAVERNRYKRQIRNMLMLRLKENSDSCQASDKHYHGNFVIIVRHLYLEKDFQTNQKNLYKLLTFISREKNR